MTPEELAARIGILKAHYEKPENKHYSRLVVDKSGSLVCDGEGFPLVEVSVTHVVKDSNDSEFTIDHLISTPRIDYIYDVMDPFGCDDTPLRKNKAVFYNHRHYDAGDLPIGKNLWLKKTREGVLVSTKYAVTEHAFAGDVYRLVKGGYLNSYSIGFFPREWDIIMIKDLLKLIDGKFDIPNSGDFDAETRVMYHPKWMCFEYSQVGVPMNQDALRKSLRKALGDGLIMTDFGKTYFGAMAEPDKVNLDAFGLAESLIQFKGLSVATQEMKKGIDEMVVQMSGSLEEIRKNLSGMSDMMTGMSEKQDQCVVMLEQIADRGDDAADPKSSATGVKQIPTVETAGTQKTEFDVLSLVERSASGAVNRAKGKIN